MVDSDTYRDVVGHFATGVTVVTFATEDLEYGLTVNSFASVSLDPPLVLWSCDKGANSHDLLADADNYAVNVLTADQEWLSNRFAGEHEDMDDPFHDVETFRAETDAPIIRDTLAYLDCTVADRVDGGDHTIYVGHVEEMGTQESAADPLTFYKGSYGTIT